MTFLEEWIKVSYEIDFKSDPELVARVIKFLNKRITKDGISGRGQESNRKIWMESSNATKEKALECLTPVKDKEDDGEVSAGGQGTLILSTSDGMNARRTLFPKKEKKTSRVQQLKTCALEPPPSPHSPTAFSKKLGLSMRNADSKDYDSTHSPQSLNFG